MRAERAGTIVAGLETLFGAGRQPVDDALLLARFADSRDEAAFRCLVERHGARVWSVCRRSLADTHAAEDAFQATFLVLARRAGRIDRPDRLAAWLAGVAQRAARKLRRAQSRRTRHERATAVLAGAHAAHRSSSLEAWELRAVLDEELDRLPESLRRAVELCYVEGKTTDEAARLLGWPRGTVGTRVARGRERLRRSLERRGVAPAVVFALPRLVPPTSLVASATRAAVGYAAGASGAGSASGVVPGAAALADSLIRSLAMQKTAIMTPLFLTCLLAGGALWAARSPATSTSRSPDSVAPLAVDDREAIQGVWAPVDVKIVGIHPKDVEDSVKAMRFHFEQDTLRIDAAGEKVSDSRVFTLDTMKRPKQLTLADTGYRELPRFWIYELEGKRLRMAAVEGLPEDAPPSSFDEQPEQGRTLFVITLIPESQAPALDAAQLERVKTARLAITRTISVNNLKQISLAVHNRAVATPDPPEYPPAAIQSKDGKPLLSWRVAILPFLEQQALYREFHLDEPWDSPHNKALVAKMPTVYASTRDSEPGKTFYRAVVGPDAAIRVDRPTPVAELTDGLSNTVLIIEARPAIEWTRPDDIAVEPGKDLPALSGPFPGGVHIVLADGSVRWIPPEKLDPATLKALSTRAGGEVIDHSKL